MPEAAQSAEAPPETVRQRFCRIFGIEGMAFREVAREAEMRVEGGLPPGCVDLATMTPRRYDTAFEAAIDLRGEQVKRERADAETAYEAERDDIAGGWGSESRLGATRARFERARERERELSILAPMSRFYSLHLRLRDAKRELAEAGGPTEPVYFEPVFVDRPEGSNMHPLRPLEGVDLINKAALRAASRATANANQPTAASRIFAEVGRLELALAGWQRENPRLVALLEAENASRA